MAAQARMAIVGMGDPVMDVLALVSHEFLSSVAGEVGGCCPVSP
ncbi:PfkB domain-containing protein, partial [Haematococcus lacustris]